MNNTALDKTQEFTGERQIPQEKGAASPDWFYVGGVPLQLDGKYRRSYVLWRKLIAPTIVLEFASGDGSEERDETPFKGKFWVYERVMRIPYLRWWDLEGNLLLIGQEQVAIERHRTEQERQRADTAERELAELRSLLQQRGEG